MKFKNCIFKMIFLLIFVNKKVFKKKQVFSPLSIIFKEIIIISDIFKLKLIVFEI